ncbi:Cof-type HAD-IIB family hydrolase [Leuconostoc miyukkimchii]|uniref:Cof-type HAD-IIB family hydrolase n=1 Tax=Leuconostoc miyukkimchii TaxID=910540 RepID=UPI001C7D5D90|nr:Cof-type HAD-IIB family hydrolase [Leuconostoc miyukkimchii]
MSIKLIASDLDATFLKNDKTFNEVLFQEVLDKLHAKGGQFVVATGNHVQKVQDYFKNFDGQYQLIANNGAEVILDGKLTHVWSVPEDVPAIIDKLADKYVDQIQLGVSFVAADKAFAIVKRPNDEQLEFSKKYFENLTIIQSVTEINEPILKISLVLPDLEYEFMREVKLLLGNRIHVTTSGYGAIDIVNSEVNKANALSYIADTLHISPSEIMAFGDGLNDLEMLEYVGQPFAMTNSDQELFQHDFSRSVTDNDNDGVLKTILEKL